MSARPPVLTNGRHLGRDERDVQAVGTAGAPSAERLRLARAAGSAFSATAACRMPRRLGQHFLRPASVEKLAPRDRPRARTTCSSRSARARARSRCPLAARVRARRGGRDRRARSRERLRERAPAERRDRHGGRARGRPARASFPTGSRLVGNLPYYVSSPLLRRFLALRGHVRDLHVMLQDEVARRVASPPGSKEYGILSVLYALWADTEIPARFPPGCLLAAARRSTRPSSAPGSATRPRAEVGDPEGFERFLQKAFARRRRTLENNLEDSYPNLKEYLRFLNVEGSRRAGDAIGCGVRGDLGAP